MSELASVHAYLHCIFCHFVHAADRLVYKYKNSFDRACILKWVFFIIFIRVYLYTQDVLFERSSVEGSRLNVSYEIKVSDTCVVNVATTIRTNAHTKHDRLKKNVDRMLLGVYFVFLFSF